ncbi:MAG: permease, partial [Anaerolineae bacterium]|nr:permease [Anaerolineae bacterium]
MPVLVQLLRHGVPPAPLLTFVVASSLMNPQLFVLMLGGLGLEMALA